MQDIETAQRRKARLPLFVCVMTFVAAAAIGWNALVSQSGTQTASAPSNANSEISELEQKPLPIADETVLEIQTALQRLDIYPGALDGLSGPATRVAVSSYQEKFGLEPNGVADQDLLAHIQYNEKLEQAAQYTGSTSPRETVQPTPSEDAPDLSVIQKGLAELGYQPGPIDGQFGEKTRTAIRDFQRDRSLQVTGDLSRELVAELAKVTGKSSLNDL